MNKNNKLLFFGRKNHGNSIKCLEHLEDLGFKVSVVWSSKRREKLPDDLDCLEVDYILCFRSYFILPESLLKIPKFYSINFHPGPPEYPGSGINFSLYEDKKEYGITIHLMSKKVDSGKIIETNYFPIFEDDNLEKLLKRTHRKLFNSFIDFTTNLKKYGEIFVKEKLDKNSNVNWSKKYWITKELDKYQIITKDIDEIELNRRIKSFNYPGFPIELELYGHRFVLKDSKKNK